MQGASCKNYSIGIFDYHQISFKEDIPFTEAFNDFKGSIQITSDSQKEFELREYKYLGSYSLFIAREYVVSGIK
ncbi:MAG: hypothetical protein ACE5R6_20465 [Candidatus Heimdallarchaeota archaeon]